SAGSSRSYAARRSAPLRLPGIRPVFIHLMANSKSRSIPERIDLSASFAASFAFRTFRNDSLYSLIRSRTVPPPLNRKCRPGLSGRLHLLHCFHFLPALTLRRLRLHHRFPSALPADQKIHPFHLPQRPGAHNRPGPPRRFLSPGSRWLICIACRALG